MRPCRCWPGGATEARCAGFYNNLGMALEQTGHFKAAAAAYQAH